MARARKKGDDLYNARRRLKRRAQRLEKAAATESDAAVKARLEAETSSLYEEAAAGYIVDRDRQRFVNSKGLQGYKVTADQWSAQKRQAYISESKRQLEGSMQNDDQRRYRTAKTLMKSPVGRRIYAATVDVWRDYEYSDRDSAIMDFFGVDSMADVIDMFEEELGEDLYEELDSEEKYLGVTAQGMAFVQDLAYGTLPLDY